MDKVLTKRIAIAVPLLFMFIVIFRITYTYNEMNKQQLEFAHKEAEVLNSYAMSYREYYQDAFNEHNIVLDEKTLHMLPAFSSKPISELFTKNNPLNISMKTVSDRARNPNNFADSTEKQAIAYFKKNPQEEQYFSDKDSNFYQFAKPLRIEAKCLLCHGEREKAPAFIQTKYNTSYDYKLGELRGVMSIKIPKEALQKYFFNNFLDAIFYDLFLFVLLFIAIFYMLKKTSTLNNYLNEEIESKTKELKDLLIYDHVSKLPNRQKLILDIADAAQEQTKRLALINIDGFKDINDFYGHDVGDEILKKISDIMSARCVLSHTPLYKLPSDEFALFTTTNISGEIFLQTLKNIVEEVAKTQLKVGEISIFVSISCGVAFNENPLLAKADMALKLSKLNKKDFILYSQKIDSSAHITSNIAGVTLIKHAIEKNNIEAFFQPIFNLQSKKIEKYESLVRIRKEDGTIAAPADFLAIALKSKLYPEITKTMIRKSFAFFKDKEYEFSLNISIEDILNPSTMEYLLHNLALFPQPQRVVFEILESDKIGNYAELKKFIDLVKKYKCKIAIDDFGSGYSNFSHVLELNIDYLKIDASLVKHITTDAHSRIITQTIINFASDIHLKTIAEYVETQEALELLEAMGADYAQGYFIGKPQEYLNTDWD